MTVIPFPSPKDFAPPAIETDALADLLFSELLSREAELAAEVEARFPWQEEPVELAVVRALLRLITANNVRPPRARLQ